MYNSLLRAALESYFLVSIGTIYGVRHGKLEDSEERVTFAITLAVLTYLIVFPISQHLFLIKKFEKLSDPIS